MALQRKNPLPVGRYWVDVPEDQFSGVKLTPTWTKFEDWLARHKDHVRVTKVEETERTLKDPAEPSEGAWPASRWYLFDVLTPVMWEGPGFPTIAEGETSKEDTVQKPEPMTPSDVLDEMLPDGESGESGTLLKGALIVAGLFAVGYVIKHVKS